jgi:hypothetical protein
MKEKKMENIEFKEYRNPAYFMKRRAIRAFWNHVVPVGICVGMFLAFVIMGYIEVCL